MPLIIEQSMSERYLPYNSLKALGKAVKVNPASSIVQVLGCISQYDTMLNEHFSMGVYLSSCWNAKAKRWLKVLPWCGRYTKDVQKMPAILKSIWHYAHSNLLKCKGKKMLEGLPQCVGAWRPRRTCSKFSPRMKWPLGHAEMHIAYNVAHTCSVFCILCWWCSIKIIWISRGWIPISIMW